MRVGVQYVADGPTVVSMTNVATNDLAVSDVNVVTPLHNADDAPTPTTPTSAENLSPTPTDTTNQSSDPTGYATWTTPPPTLPPDSCPV